MNDEQVNQMNESINQTIRLRLEQIGSLLEHTEQELCEMEAFDKQDIRELIFDLFSIVQFHQKLLMNILEFNPDIELPAINNDECSSMFL